LSISEWSEKMDTKGQVSGPYCKKVGRRKVATYEK